MCLDQDWCLAELVAYLEQVAYLVELVAYLVELAVCLEEQVVYLVELAVYLEELAAYLEELVAYLELEVTQESSRVLDLVGLIQEAMDHQQRPVNMVCRGVQALGPVLD